MKAIFYFSCLLWTTDAIAAVNPYSDPDGPYNRDDTPYSGPGVVTEVFQIGISAIIAGGALVGLLFLLKPIFYNKEEDDLNALGKTYIGVAFIGFFYLMIFIGQKLFH